MLHTCAGFTETNNNQGQQGQQSPQICVYCGSTEHSSSNCHRRPWDNREQPHSTPDSLRRDQQANSKILGNATGRTASTVHPCRYTHPSPNLKGPTLKIQEIWDQITNLHNITEKIITITGSHRDSLMQGLIKDTTRGTHPLYSHQHHH